jgi:hypothetical protein
MAFLNSFNVNAGTVITLNTVKAVPLHATKVLGGKEV